jgi:hypothetical protein
MIARKRPHRGGVVVLVVMALPVIPSSRRCVQGVKLWPASA